MTTTVTLQLSPESLKQFEDKAKEKRLQLQAYLIGLLPFKARANGKMQVSKEPGGYVVRLRIQTRQEELDRVKASA